MNSAETPKACAMLLIVTVLYDSKNCEYATILISLMKYFLCTPRYPSFNCSMIFAFNNRNHKNPANFSFKLKKFKISQKNK